MTDSIKIIYVTKYLYRNVQEEMKKLCEEKHACDETSDVKIDERSVMPIPQTTNGLVRYHGLIKITKNYKKNFFVIHSLLFLY